jgi:hypothetical protein
MSDHRRTPAATSGRRPGVPAFATARVRALLDQTLTLSLQDAARASKAITQAAD